MKIAISGATGFVGANLIDMALKSGHSVRALTRRPQPERPGVEWILGSIDPAENLDALVAGADAVIHVAGAINAPDRASFAACNIDGTSAMVAAATDAGISRFIHVSSLAAREPALSDYGWSKAESERRVEGSPLAWTIVRPPAIYGAGDREMLELFRMAARGVVLLPPKGRLSLIAVSDLCRLLLSCATGEEGLRKIYEPDDGQVRGYDHRDFARLLGAAVGRRIVPVPVPRLILGGASLIDRLFRGGKAKLSADRVRYFCHPDWVCRRSMAPPVRLWQPEVPAAPGLKATAEAYRRGGLL